MTDWRANIDLFSADTRQKGGKRTERVADLIRNEVSLMLLSRIKDPRLTGVSIVHVVLTKDFKKAKVFYSVYGDEQKAREAAVGLQRAKGFIRKYLATNLNLRSTPELVFERDLSMVRQEEMEKIFKEIHRDDESAQ